MIFIWTPPHFWALAIQRRRNIAKADIPMLPVTHGVDFTRLHILLYTLMLVAVTLLPFVTQMSGGLYLGRAIVLGIGFLYHAVRLYREQRRPLQHADLRLFDLLPERAVRLSAGRSLSAASHVADRLAACRT